MSSGKNCLESVEKKDSCSVSKQHLNERKTHHLHHHPENQTALFWALLLTAGFGLIEFIAGLWSGSLALISDAGHMATDAASLFLAWIAVWFMKRPASEKLSFGYLRAEVLAAFINALAMGVLIGVICWEALSRFIEPHSVAGKTVLEIGVFGLIVNLFVLFILQGKHTSVHELNRRAALLHVVGDALGSIAAIVSGIVILTTGWILIDPILSIFICLLLARSTWNLLRESIWVLMEGVPRGIDYMAVSNALQAIAGVKGIHDLHIWSMAPMQPAISAHIKVADLNHWTEILLASQTLLRQNFGIDHITLQPELNSVMVTDNHCACPINKV